MKRWVLWASLAGCVAAIAIALTCWLAMPPQAVERENRPLPAADNATPSESPAPADPSDAIAYWLNVRKSAPRYSPRWWDSMYGQFEAMERLGKREKVRQLLENLRLVEPALGGPKWFPRFKSLGDRVGLSSGW